MTVLERLETLSDKLTLDADNFDYVNTACVFFMNQLPESLAQDFFIEEEVPADSTRCSAGMVVKTVTAEVRSALRHHGSERPEEGKAQEQQESF